MNEILDTVTTSDSFISKIKFTRLSSSVSTLGTTSADKRPDL